MKILLCSPTFQTITHGPAKFAHLIFELNQHFPQHELRILTEGIEREIPGQIYKIVTNYPRPVHALGKFLRMWSYHQAARKLQAEFPFDVIVYNDAIQGLLSAILFRRSSIKVAGMLNDDEYLSTDLRSFRFSRKWLIKWLHKPFERLSVHLMNVTITCSRYLRDRTLKEYKCPPDKVTYLYQSVNQKKWPFTPRRWVFNPGQRIKVLFVKSDYMRGGLSFLITALSQIKAFHFELIIIGPLWALKPRIERLYINDQHIMYTFMGPQFQSIVLEKMKTSDILCVPSLREGLGVVNIEGLAVGIPIVSSRVGGIPEVLGDGAYGWLAEAGNADSLAETLTACIDNPEERKKRSEAGRKHVENHFEHQKMLQRFLKILDKT